MGGVGKSEVTKVTKKPMKRSLSSLKPVKLLGSNKSNYVSDYREQLNLACS